MPFRFNPITGELDIVDTTTGPPSSAEQFDCDTGTAIPVANIINMLGDATQGISSTGAGNTVTYTIDDASETQKGVSELATDAEAIAGTDSSRTIVPSSLKAKLGSQTQYAVAYGNSDTNAIEWTAALTDGQLVIGATGASPAAATLLSSDSSITITNSANSIDLSAGFIVATQFDTDSGTATPSAGVLDILGGTLMNTAGATSVVTINADDNVVGGVDTDGSSVVPTSNAFTIAGGTNCTTSGSGAIVTIDVDGNIADSYITDSGTATPSSGDLNVLGGDGCTTSGSGNTITIDVDGAGLDWSVETGTSATLVANTGVFANNGAGVTLSLPSTAAVGDTFEVVAMDAAGWTVDQQTGQSVQVGSSVTTTTTGTIVSTGIGDWIQIVCNVANTSFFACVKQGNVTIT